MFDIKYTVIDEIKFFKKGEEDNPGTWLRLAESGKGKRVIQSWSNMSKQWNVVYRYGVEEAWASWKRTEASIKGRKEEAVEATKKVRKPRKKAEKPVDKAK